MRLAALMAIAGCAPGCQVVFPRDVERDLVPHVAAEDNEAPGEGDVLITTHFDYDTTDVSQALGGNATFEKIRQDTDVENIDVVVMRVANLKIANGGELFITGSTPLLIIAKTVEIDGVIDASAHLNGLQPGPGGGRPGMRDPGEGGLGVVGPQNNNTGGGGGGFATAGGDGGAVECAAQVQGGGGGVAHGDPQLTVLRGGGAGGSGGPRCPTITERGGFGGGALQISATESITISGTGKVRASGGGGNFGSGDCNLRDDAGSGGGAGGAIYLDAPRIANEGVVEAFGGGGGGGGDDVMPSGNAGDGNRGHWGNEFMIVAPAVTLLPSVGGAGQPSKGTDGGNGARSTAATSGAVGDCANTLQPFFNTGGGGGAAGRIVVRTRGEVSPFGTIEPPPTKLDYVVP